MLHFFLVAMPSLVIGLLLANQVIVKQLTLPQAGIVFLVAAVHSLQYTFSEYASATPFAVLELITSLACLMALFRVC